MMFKKEGFPANKEEMLMTLAMMTFVRHAKNVESGAKKKKATTKPQSGGQRQGQR